LEEETMASATPKNKTKEQREAVNEPNPTTGAVVPSRGDVPAVPLREEFDRLFDRMLRGWQAPWDGGRGDWQWAVAVQERDDAVVVRAEAPGFEPSDFDLKVRGDNLILHAAHKSESRDGDDGWAWSQQEYYRSVPLPAATDPDRVAAQYRHGVLTVTLPRTEDRTARRIAVSG